MSSLRWLAFLILVLSITGCDHATKLLAADNLSQGHAVSLISGVLSLDRAHNTDTGFSLLSGIIPMEPRLLLLKTTATLGTVFLAVLTAVRFGRSKLTERLAYACLLGGAAGNAIDRWRWGYVIDFIRIEHWPTFNVADCALCVGAGLLLLSIQQGTQRAGEALARVEPPRPGSDR